jgi:hypothetical protein
MSFLAPLFFLGLAAIAVPILVHLIERERKDIVEFPSLMFIERVPYQSVERRRIHNWWLLLMRAGAMVLLIAAFARPFLTVDPVAAAGAVTGAREVVILLDRSASMGYGDVWERAKAEALQVVDGLSGTDQGTLVLFATGAEETVRATSDRSQLEAAINNAEVSAYATRFAPALRLAQSLLLRSTLPRREVVLISDFQKSGWERREEVGLPEGATITPISVGVAGTSDLAVTSVVFQRASFSGEERVSVVAGLTNRSAEPVANLPVTLELDGRAVGSRNVSIEPNASASVTFPPVTVADANVRGTISAGADDLPANNVFHFVLSPSRPLSVLVIQGEGTAMTGPGSPSLFLATALETSQSPPFAIDVLTAARVTPEALGGRSVVVLNNATSLSTEVDTLLARFVNQGGGLFVALGERSPWNTADAPLLPGDLSGTTDRPAVGGGTLGFLDYSHPVFDQFKDPRNGNFANTRIYRYRRLTPADTDHVLARFDDGGAAFVERRVGAGHVIAWTSTLDRSWNNFPNQHLFVPVMHDVMRYLSRYEEPVAWQTVGGMLDVSQPVAAAVREGAVTAAAGDATGIVMAPSGDQLSFGSTGASAVELAEQGFYSVRLQGSADRRPFAVAVNLDPAESDLAAIPPQEFATSATGQAAAVVGPGQSLERPELTPADLERRQSSWWFLFVAGAALLLGEAVLSNRLSKGFSPGVGRAAAKV